MTQYIQHTYRPLQECNRWKHTLELIIYEKIPESEAKMWPGGTYIHTCESEKVKVKEEGMFFIQMVLNQLNRRNKVYTMYIHTCTQGCHCKLLTGSHWPPDVWKVCGRLLPGLVLVPSEYYSVAVYVLDQCCSRVLRVCVYTYQVLHTRSVHKRYIHSRQRQ